MYVFFFKYEMMTDQFMIQFLMFQEVFRYKEGNYTRQFWWIPISGEVFGINSSPLPPSQVLWMKPQHSEIFPRPGYHSSVMFSDIYRRILLF